MFHLMWLFGFPLALALLLLCLPRSLGRIAMPVASLGSLFPLALLLYGYGSWTGTSVDYVWIPPLAIHWHLAVDSLSLIFLYLTALIIPISLLTLWMVQPTAPPLFAGLILLLQALLIGFFTARDLALFTIFWEAMLLPIYFIITLWGGPQRQQTAIRFLTYMFAGSALMVAAVLGLYFAAQAFQAEGSFDFGILRQVTATTPYAAWFAAIFFLAFAVKTPLFPFHAWLPDSYTQAPLAGTILLSALLSKAGLYGFLRLGLEFFPNYLEQWSWLLLTLAVAGVLYGGMVAWRQRDFKRLIAYSSFSHVNFIAAGIFVASETAHTGAVLQAFNHGVTITGLFLVAGWLEQRLGTTALSTIRGVADAMPKLCWITLFFVLSSIALPGTNNFIGELLILFGVFGVHPWLTVALTLTVILSALYMLRWMQTVYFETPSPRQPGWVDIKASEIILALPLILLILWIGIYPAPLLREIEPVDIPHVAVHTVG